MSDSYKDAAFPPNDFSFMGKGRDGAYLDQFEAKQRLIKDSEVEWKRITDIVPKPVIFEDTINMQFVKYGRVSLPYFYSVLSALADKCPSIFTKIIVNKDFNPKGQYQVKLYVDGQCQTITIDDYFPVLKGTNVYFFTRPSNFEIWPLLIEKAWAKVNGGYLNIINLWPGDLFKALTGFTYDELIHPDMREKELFEQLSDIKKNKGFAFGLTKDNPEVEQKGLYIYRTYIVENVEKIEIGNEIYTYLVKLRDPELEQDWNGDYSPTSNLWTDKIKSSMKDKSELRDGEFWISITDYLKLFLRTDICHMLTDGYTKYFKFKKVELTTPKVFNYYVQEDGIVSISILEKNWHFHRELRNISHPTSLIVAEYDPSNNSIKKIYSKYENNEDLELTKTLTKGYYLVWAYKTTDPNEKIAAEEMVVRFCAIAKGSVNLVGDDTDFELIRNLISTRVKEENKEELQKEDFFYAVDNSFEQSGIAYEMAVNPLNNVYQVWKVDSTSTHGYLILPPYVRPEFEIVLGYNDYQIILGIKRYKYGKHCLNLAIDVNILRGSQDPPMVLPKPNVDKYFAKDNKSFKALSEKPTFSSSDIRKAVKFPTLNHWDLFLQKHKAQYPLAVEELKKLQPLTQEIFDLNVIEMYGNTYIGEADYGIRYGRGAYIFGKEGTTYIGYWDKGMQFVKGKVFDRSNRLIFEGEYKNGLRDGKGVYNYQGGEKYEGMFAKGLKDGKGIFTWNDGLKWDGNFKKDNLEGEGTFFDGKETFKATFKDGNLVES